MRKMPVPSDTHLLAQSKATNRLRLPAGGSINARSEVKEVSSLEDGPRRRHSASVLNIPGTPSYQDSFPEPSLSQEKMEEKDPTTTPSFYMEKGCKRKQGGFPCAGKEENLAN